MSLIKKLKIVGNVYISGWPIINHLVDSINNGDGIILESKWFDEYKKNNLEAYPLDLSKISTWSTNDDGIHLQFWYNESFYCKAIVSDVSSNNRFIFTSKFEALLKLNDSFIYHIEDSIDRYFNLRLEKEYEQELERRKNDWIEKRKKDYYGF